MKPPLIHSGSVGEPVRFRPLEEILRAMREAPAAPRDRGRVALIVRRGEGGVREVVEHVRVTSVDGIPGDAWSRKADRNPEMQIAVMQADVAELIANGQPLTLFGDQLFLTLDLSEENLPAGSRVRIGDAVLEVTPMPHNGCRKFLARFGADALRFVAEPERRRRNLRGIYLRVVRDGDVRRGDPAEVLERR